MASQDVIILGAGLSGLACALTLQKNGIRPLVIEPAPVVGGRVRSHTSKSGFIIDRGFQVILSSYPEFEKFVDLSQLNLKNFNSGALIYTGTSLDLLANPLVHPTSLVSTFLKKFISTKDKALVVKLIIQCQFQRTDFPMGERSTLRFLQDFGFSKDFIELFWRPFLAGVYLDSDLGPGENFFKFLVRCFASGKVSVPANGIAELPLKMAARLPKDSILLGETAQSWTSDHVTLANGKKINAKKIICAFDPEASRATYQSVETYYFTSQRLSEVDWGKWLVLVPQTLGLAVNHFCLLSSVAENYGKGGPLLSVSVVGKKNVSLEQIQKELDQIAKMELKLELVEKVIVDKALPKISQASPGFKVTDKVIYCGDQWASPSINGALSSGRLAAEFAMQDLS
jgi:hypothetical protein